MSTQRLPHDIISLVVVRTWNGRETNQFCSVHCFPALAIFSAKSSCPPDPSYGEPLKNARMGRRSV